MEGIGWFTHEIMKRVAAAHPEHEFHFIFDRPFSKEFLFAPNVIPHILPPQARHPLLYKIWYDYSIPFLLKKIKADLFISPDAMLSLRTSIPQLIVIHDLNFEHYPEDVPAVYTRYLKKRSPLFAAKAKRIVTVSEFSKHDISKLYGTALSKIDVVHNGVHAAYHPISDDEKNTTRTLHSDGKPYFVFVSSIHPRKNLQRLLPAFDIFKEQTQSDVKLVVVGQKFWFNETLQKAFDSMKHKADVVFSGRMDVVDLNKVVASSIASVYPSYFEGFGIPVIEAFQCEAPVITSTETSLPEVAGDAALLVDPFSIQSIADALLTVYEKPEIRAELIEKGKERIKHFSWDISAEKFWESIQKTIA